MPWGSYEPSWGNVMLSNIATAAARRFHRFAWCSAMFGVTVVTQQAALAQTEPRVCVVAAEVDTGPVHAIGDFPGNKMLIGAE